ncbi:MAG: hypothetical protein ACI4SL_01250, partial [Candidatus Ornithospirochaeta sp.]
MKINEAIDKWIRHEGFKPQYGYTVRNLLNKNIGSLFPTLDASKLSEEHIKKGIDSMKARSLSEKYINVFRLIANRFIGYITENNISFPAPSSKKKAKKKSKKKSRKREYYTGEEEKRIREAIPHLPLKDLYQFSLDTGITGSMARAIRQENVDIDKGTILLSEKVLKRTDDIVQLPSPITYRMDDAIKHFVSNLLNGRKYLFYNKDNEHIDREEIRRNDLMLKMLTGIPHITLNRLAEHTI